MNASQPASASNPAQAYEDYNVPAMFRPWARDLLDRAGPRAGERVLDLACGTGIVARMAAHRLGSGAVVAGLDINPAMLEVARSKAAQEGVEVAWREGDVAELPFVEASFDLVVIQQGLQFFPDKPAALAEAWRVLAPAGRIASSTWTGIEDEPLTAAFAAAILRRLGTDAMRTPYAFGDREALLRVFDEAGFTAIEIERVELVARFPSPQRYVELGMAAATAGVLAFRQMDVAAQAAAVRAIQADMEAPIRALLDGDEIVVPQVSHVVLARKAG
jgi:ubiquinone/menaquinone biosynthesis C-methylase UbiE